MLLWENIQLAIASLFSNKMRALLTMLGIIIGIAAVIAILTVGNSLTTYMSQMMQSMGSNDIFVTLRKKSAEKQDINAADFIDGIKYPAS
jgi:putative ABC transport system permease protein